MVAAYREALISYWRSRFFSIVMLMIALETVLWTVKNSATYGWLNNWLVWAADGFFIGAVIALHVAGRLSDYRIRLVPHYREVHLAALTTMLLAALAALIGWTQWRLDGPQAGSVGMIVLAMVVGCWGLLRFVWLGMVFAVPAMCRTGQRSIPDAKTPWRSRPRRACCNRLWSIWLLDVARQSFYWRDLPFGFGT